MSVTSALLASAFVVGSTAAPALQNERPDSPPKAELKLDFTSLAIKRNPEGLAEEPSGFRFGSWVSAIQVEWPHDFSGPDREQTLQTYHARARPRLDKVIERLRDGLGPAWRVGHDHWQGTNSPRTMNRTDMVQIQGPRSEDPSAPQLKAAILALSEEQKESERARSLPAGPERTDAEAKASAAAARADEAMSAIRIESVIIPVEHADGEDIAQALKLALPWATFTSIGGAQIMASGTKAELDAAKTLVIDLDAAAKRQMEDASRSAADRGRDTPAGRVLAQQINVDFEGGELTGYLDQIGGVANVTSWVIEDPRVSSAYVPSVKLTGVTVDSALKLLDGMVFPSADKAQPMNATLRVMRIDPDDSNPDAPPIYRIGAIFPSEPSVGPARPAEARPREQRTLTEVFGVSVPDPGEGEDGAVKTRQAHEALLSAIEAGVGLVGPSPTFKVKLHPPSGMLFVSGTSSELELVRNIVQQWQSQL